RGPVAGRARVVGREQGRRRGRGGGLRVDRQGKGGTGRADVARGVGGRGGDGIRPVGQGRGQGDRVRAARGRRRAHEPARDEEPPRRAGLGRADQPGRIVVRDPVADGARVVRRKQARGDWCGGRCRVDRQREGDAGGAGVAGGIGDRGREGIGPVEQGG